MASPIIETFWNDLINDIKSNRLVLPTLPEVALKARKLLNQPNVTSTQIAKVISLDVALTTRLLRIANSPLYRTRTQIEDVKQAITRLGNASVRSLITSLAMEQLYQPRLAPEIKKRMQMQWKRSVHVAALSQVIAKKFTRLKADEAMLGGLVHDIGILPILEYAERIPTLMENEQALDKVVDVLHPKVGNLILKAWKFQPDMISVAAEHENLERDPGTDADYTDVVIVANLLRTIGTDHPHAKLDWTQIPAFNRLAMSPEESIEAIKEAKEEIQEIQTMLAA